MRSSEETIFPLKQNTIEWFMQGWVFIFVFWGGQGDEYGTSLGTLYGVS